MTTNVRQLLKSFEQLPQAEQHEAAIEILRRSVSVEPISLDDAVLVERAEELFLSLDDEEAASERA